MSSSSKLRESEEEQLRYWLVNEDVYMSRFTRLWLERTPPGEAADMLARIAEDAQPEPRDAGSRFLMMMALSGFSMTGAIAGKGFTDRRAGTRAAVMLANLGDARAIPPLVRVFEMETARQGKHQELVEGALLRFLSQEAGDAEERRQYVPFVRDLARRIWRHGGLNRDLPGAYAHLLLTALRWLCCRDEAAAEPEDTALLRSVAESDVKKPNRAYVRDMARALLNE